MFQASSDPDYFTKTTKALQDRINAMAITNPRQIYRNINVGWMKTEDVHVVKRAAVVDSVMKGRDKIMYGIVGPDNAKRQTIDPTASPNRILIRVGNYGMTKNEGPKPRERGTRKESRTSVSVSVSQYPGAFLPADQRNGVRGRNSKGNAYGHSDRFRQEIRGGRLYVTRTDSNATFGPNAKWGGVSQKRGSGRGWGQDMYTYIYVPPKMDKYLTSRTIGSVTPRTIWGSALKYSDVRWKYSGNAIFTAADVAKLPIDKVPRWIHYPMAHEDNTPVSTRKLKS